MNWDLFWKILWITWVCSGVIAETIALIVNYKWTLSEEVWALEGKGGTLIQFALAAFLFWLFLHLPFRLFHRLR